LHVAAAAGLVPDDALGRPRRTGELPGDGADLLTAPSPASGEPGTPVAVPAPEGAALTARLDTLAEVLREPGEAPALIVAAVAHAEVATARPFLAGNGVVARALCRAVVVGRGLDPQAVAVWEVPLFAAG